MQTEIILAFIALAGTLAGVIGNAFASHKNRKNAIDGEFKKGVTDSLAELKPIKETLELHTAHLRENYLELLRMKIFATDLPLEERVNAGEKALAAGTNGSAKIQHEENVVALKEARRK